MSKISKEVIITDSKNYNESKEFSNKYNKEPELRSSSSLALWSEQLVVLAMTHLNPFANKRQDKKVLRQQRSYEKMKLNFSNEKIILNKSISAESIMIQNNQILIHEPFVRIETSRNGSYDTISDDSQSDNVSQTSTSSSSSANSSLNSTSSISSYGYGSLFDINSPKNSDNVRVVQRFGNEFRDKCLFPLALAINEYEIFKGKSTWNSILMRADFVLNKWQQCSANLRKVNRVLGSPSDFVCPDSSLINEFLLHPRAREPLKRWNSYEDLQQVIHEQNSVKTISGAKSCASTDDTLFASEQFETSDKDYNNKTQSDLMIRKSSETSEELYELKVFKSNSSPIVTKESAEHQNPKYDAKTLIKSIKINSPLSLALQITTIDKECLLRLINAQLFSCMIGKYGINKSSDRTQLNALLEFGQELNRLVLSVIRKEITPETQGKKIAGFIEVACALRRLRNWQSLSTVIRALQSPKIYFMEEAWMHMKRTYPIHYNDYLKLCRLVRNCETSIMGTTRPSIPSIVSLVSTLRIHCIATWDLLESKRRWTEQPSIAGWLNHELIGQLVESQKLRQKQEENYILSLNESQCSHLPVNDQIRLIHYSSLPKNWTEKDIKFIPYTHLKQIIKCFNSSFKNEINSIQQYFIPNYKN